LDGEGNALSIARAGESRLAGLREEVLRVGDVGDIVKRVEVSNIGTLDDSSSIKAEPNKDTSCGPENITSLEPMRGVERKSLRGVSPGDSPKVSKEGVQGDVRNSLGSKEDMDMPGSSTTPWARSLSIPSRSKSAAIGCWRSAGDTVALCISADEGAEVDSDFLESILR
jgi:hypothetical protein